MKQPKQLSNHDLHIETLSAAATEKQATLILLEFLAEVDRRRLYAERGYSSLWEYVVKALSYSEAQASDRVNSMRLMVRVPEVAQELKSGKLNLTSTAKLASHVRREKLTASETVTLLPKITERPTREVEQILLAESKDGAPKLTRLTLEVDDEFLAMLGRVKELNGSPAAGHEELIGVAMKEFIKRRAVKPEPPAGLKSKETSATEVRSVKTQTPEKTRYIPAQIRNSVRHRAEDRCEFLDSLTGRRCECKTGLEFEHFKVPLAMGGEHSLENLVMVCTARY